MPEATSNKTAPRSRRSAPQARGEARREKLLATTIELLDKRDISDITLADAAELAGIPIGSAYHFFPNISAIYSELTVQYSYSIADHVFSPLSLRKNDEWQDLIKLLCDRIVAFYANHHAYAQIRLSGKAPSEIRFTSQRKRGSDSIPVFISFIEQYFELPPLANLESALVTFLNIIVDGIYMNAYMETGSINESTAEEAKRAGIAYLRSYLPEYLPRRQTTK